LKPLSTFSPDYEISPRLVDVDRVVRATGTVQIGAFRCPVVHPAFADSGPIRNPCFVFPRTPVVIRHRDAQPFAADPTLVTLYNQGQEYGRVAVSPDGDLCDWYAISPELLREAVAAYDPAAADEDRPIRFPFVRTDAAIYLHQRRFFTAILRTPELDGFQVDESVFELLDRVLMRAYGRPRDGAALDKSTRPELIRDICELMGRRFVEALTLTDVARALGVSVFHMCRTFRKATGTTIHAYRNQLRLRTALARLEDADCDLSQLALDLGFSSHSHFTASFRAAFGKPPSATRRDIRATS